MINFGSFYQIIAKNQLVHWLETLPAQISLWNKKFTHKRFKKWASVIELLPEIVPYEINLLDGIIAKSKYPLSKKQKLLIERLMRNLIPWRKGPFSLYGLYIDAEWRSDWKWNRLIPYLSNLTGKTVLDVGCGNGYHLWRMVGAGANLAIGIDPSQLFLCQFEAVRKLLGNDQRVHLLPLSIEQMPSLTSFDTVFSMGVLYHRHSQLEHLRQLKNQLISGGELILETLVIKGNEPLVLAPKSHYAQMRNVYFIPSIYVLENWLSRCGFDKINTVSICATTTEEQRCTNWMFGDKSLADFLDPQDPTRTIEGYPAPIRAILTATKI